MKRFLYTLTGALLILTACNQQKKENSGENDQIVTEQAVQRLDSTLQSFVETEVAAGTSALIYEDGEEVYYNAFGYADRENGDEMDRNTLVQIFSMTKPITGVALMTLYEEGAFQLDHPLEDYLPEFADLKVYEGIDEDGNPILVEPKRPVTVRDITRHTAGFANDRSAPYTGELLAEADPRNRENTLAEFAEKLGSLPLVFHPGEKWLYGLSVDVQAYLVEKLSGQPFAEYVQEHILDPLEMDETRYFVPEEDQGRLASIYMLGQDSTLEKVPDENALAYNTGEWPMTPGGSGFTSTLDDYMTFARMLLNEGTWNDKQILKPATVRMMATNHLSEDVTDRLWLPSKGQVGFGIDFAVRLRPPASADENMGAVGEFFWDGAASTLFWVDPKNELTAVFFVQRFPFDGRLHKDFRDAVYGKYSAESSKGE